MSFAMPAEFAPHERTLMAWPARPSLWEQHYEQAKADYAEIANAIAAFEPVLMVAHPAQAAEARAACSEGVEVGEIPIDDSWMRDSGPVFVLDGAGARAGVDFAFNAWGEKFDPYRDDAEMAARVLAHLGEERIGARDLVLEGGSIASDGAGTLITTEQCLLHPTRNPGLSRDRIERRLQEALGADTVVWLGHGLIEDVDTDGHVDNLCAPIAPGRVLLQTVADEANPNWASTRENAARLEAAGVEVVELPLLPYVDHDGPPTVVPYTNFYICNGALIVPVTGQATDEEALALLDGLYPGREVVPVPGVTLALGGGGVHCITQQVPAVVGAHVAVVDG
jgi:agmatine deiminase